MVHIEYSQARDQPQTSVRSHIASTMKKTSSQQVIQVDNESILLIRKPIKNAYMRVKVPDGWVEVTAPTSMPQQDIAKLVQSRWSWIQRTKKRIAEAQAEIQNKQMESGTGESSQERVEQARQIITNQLPHLLATWVPIVGKEPSAITLRSMKTRWGSCTPATGRIRLNIELAWVEPQLLEYVFVHELTHLRASGHGQLFQSLMSEYLPQWKSLRRQLNQHMII